MSIEEQSVMACVEEVWRTGREQGLGDHDIQGILRAVLEESKAKEQDDQLKENSDTSVQRISCKGREDASKMPWKLMRCVCKFLFIAFIMTVVLHTAITLHNPTRKFLTRNIQDLIYPTMTALRMLTLPLISKFPGMNQWYSEECLVSNPFFDLASVDCIPCMEDTDPILVSEMKNFTDIYYNNCKYVIIEDAVELGRALLWLELIRQLDGQENDSSVLKISPEVEGYMDLIRTGVLPSASSHIEWKVDGLKTLHIIRQYFPRLYFVPLETEVAFHRYVFIDGPDSAQYSFPVTEFANVLLVQGEGNSSISLEPSPHCHGQHDSVKINLKTNQVLFYNWIFWRPIRFNGEGVSTIFMSSFY